MVVFITFRFSFILIYYCVFCHVNVITPVITIIADRKKKCKNVFFTFFTNNLGCVSQSSSSCFSVFSFLWEWLFFINALIKKPKWLLHLCPYIPAFNQRTLRKKKACHLNIFPETSSCSLFVASPYHFGNWCL